MNSTIRASVMAAVAAILGATIWTLISYYGNVEIGWIAWGIGFVVGIATRIGAGEKQGFSLGAIAAAFSIAAILIGKYTAVYLAMESATGSMQITFGPENLQMQAAHQVVEEWTKENKEIQWKPGMDLDKVEKPTDFPPEVWQEALARWNTKTPEQQANEVKEMNAQFASAVQGFKQQGVWEAFKGNIGLFDLLFFGLAIFTAFKIGSGMAGGDE